jgi:hypothetical protein
MRDVLQLIAQTLPPWPSLWRCALTGALGIAAGFAVFLLWVDEITRGPVQFVVAFGVAVLVAFAFDSFQEEVEGRQHHWNLPRLLILVVLLTIAELFVMGFHSTAMLKSEEWHHVLEALLGDVAQLHVMGIVGLWLVLGAAIAVGLGTTIFNTRCEIPEGEAVSWSRPGVWARPMIRSALRGGITGAVAGPVCMLLYIFVARSLSESPSLFTEPARWRRHLEGAAQAMSEPGWTWLVWVPIQAILRLDGFFALFTIYSSFLTLAVLVALLVVCARLQAVRTLLVILATIAVVYGYPFAADSRVLRLAGLMAYLWAVPGLLLGALTPWLKRPSGNPRLWGVVAFAASVILVVASSVFPWLLALAAILGAFAFSFRQSLKVEQYWVVLALSVATNVSGVTHLFARADFFNIQKDSLELTNVPLQVFARRPAVDPAVLAKYLKQDEALTRLQAEPGLWGSRFPPPGSVDLSRAYLGRSPSRLGSTPSEILVADDLDALQAELERTTKLEAAFAERRQELMAMKAAAEGKQEEIAKAQTRVYHEHHKGLKELAAWTTTTLERHKKLDGEITDALKAERGRETLGRASYPGELSAAAFKKLQTLRQQQPALQAERQKLLATLEQVQKQGQEAGAALQQLNAGVERAVVELQRVKLWAFEVALTGSSGFWITLGLLASWSIRRQQAAGPRHGGEPLPED